MYKEQWVTNDRKQFVTIGNLLFGDPEANCDVRGFPGLSPWLHKSFAIYKRSQSSIAVCSRSSSLFSFNKKLSNFANSNSYSSILFTEETLYVG